MFSKRNFKICRYGQARLIWQLSQRNHCVHNIDLNFPELRSHDKNAKESRQKKKKKTRT